MAVAGWGNGRPIGMDLLNQILCQISQHGHLHYHVWKNFYYISERDHSLHASVDHVCNHLPHDLLRSTVSG